MGHFTAPHSQSHTTTQSPRSSSSSILTMPSFKLVYFNGRGRAESIRMALAAAEQEYEDKRITGEEWGAMEPDCPFNGLPMLEVDGKKLGQSGTILRYLGKELGLAGSNSMEAAQIDAMADTVTDVREKPIPFFFEKDEEKKKTELQKAFTETVPEILAKLEAAAGGDGFLVGDKPSYADCHLLAVVDGYQRGPLPEPLRISLDKYPKLAGVVERTKALPGVAKYLSNRPETAF